MDKTDTAIDFVITWVDGDDPAWKKEFGKYRKLYSFPVPPTDSAGSVIYTCESDAHIDVSAERYRDWGTLKYWFRSVEKFAPWVNRIHLITWGHVPQWLNVSHPKLRIVRHEDFIPAIYLPTFSSCPIELNIHRIAGLAERFVYFNDDMFLCRPVPAQRFFKEGRPRDAARLGTIQCEPTGHIMLECVKIINERYRKAATMAHHPGKWFNMRYSLSDMAKTATLMPWSNFTGFREYHMPQPFLKGTFERLWKEEAQELDKTCRSKFRNATDLSQWVMRYEQLASGNFKPVSMRDTLLTKLSDGGINAIRSDLLSGQYSMMCINDNNAIENTEAVRQMLINAFETLLPAKSAYEL